MKIISNDGYVFNQSKEKIYNVLCDFNSYKKWWPGNIVFKVILNLPEKVGSKIKIKPYGFLSFFWTITEIYPNEKIVIKYCEGIYTGQGVWSLQRQKEKTYVNFSIEIESNNLIIEIVNMLFSIKRIHKRMMKKVFFRLHE